MVADGAAAPDVDEVRAHCGDILAAYKQPRRVVIVDALPRTVPTGQIQRTLIVERIVSGSYDDAER